MNHEKRKLAAVQAVQAVHQDPSVDLGITRDSLHTIRIEVETLLEAVEGDLAMARKRNS